jgi:hypothetical protein
MHVIKVNNRQIAVMNCISLKKADAFKFILHIVHIRELTNLSVLNFFGSTSNQNIAPQQDVYQYYCGTISLIGHAHNPTKRVS